MRRRKKEDLEARVARLEEEVANLRREREGHSLSELLTGDGTVPLSRVISEYLYGEEEGTNG